jgi:hypothetical protein
VQLAGMELATAATEKLLSLDPLGSWCCQAAGQAAVARRDYYSRRAPTRHRYLKKEIWELILLVGLELLLYEALSDETTTLGVLRHVTGTLQLRVYAALSY